VFQDSYVSISKRIKESLEESYRKERGEGTERGRKYLVQGKREICLSPFKSHYKKGEVYYSLLNLIRREGPRGNGKS